MPMLFPDLSTRDELQPAVMSAHPSTSIGRCGANSGRIVISMSLRWLWPRYSTFGFLISAIHSPTHLRDLLAFGFQHNHEEITGPFDISAALMMGTVILMSVFYCTEALHSERRDRSILFWKSLPVSDAMTVLVKASIPLLILPVLISAIVLVMQFLMLLLSSAILLATGGSVATLWSHLPVIQMSLLMLYHVLTAHALWPAPVYCYLLLVSGWARRATFLWAALPIVAIGGLEKIAFNTTHFAVLVGSRLYRHHGALCFYRCLPDQPHDPHHSRCISSFAGSVDGAVGRRNIPVCRSPFAAFARPYLNSSSRPILSCSE